MRTVTMMSGDQRDHKHTNGYYNEEPDQKSSKYDFYFKEPCYYSHTIYSNAGKIFNALRQETREEQENPYYRKQVEVNQTTSKRTVEIPDIDFQDDAEKRLTFELAFEALKCKYANNAPVICNHCSPTYGEGRAGKGGDYDFSVSVPCYKSQPQGANWSKLCSLPHP